LEKQNSTYGKQRIILITRKNGFIGRFFVCSLRLIIKNNKNKDRDNLVFLSLKKAIPIGQPFEKLFIFSIFSIRK